jgi:hypothetical protein
MLSSLIYGLLDALAQDPLQQGLLFIFLFSLYKRFSVGHYS